MTDRMDRIFVNRKPEAVKRETTRLNVVNKFLKSFLKIWHTDLKLLDLLIDFIQSVLKYSSVNLKWGDV